LRFLLADAEFQRIEEVYICDESTLGGRVFSRFSFCSLNLDVRARSTLRKLGSYRATRSGPSDQGEVEPYRHPKERDLVRNKLQRAANTYLIPKEFIIQVLGVRLAWEFAPDTNEGERDFSRHVS